MLTEQGKTALPGMPQDERARYSLRLAGRGWFSRTFSLDWSCKGTTETAFSEEQAMKALATLHAALGHYVDAEVEIPPVTPAGRLALAIYNDVHGLSRRLGQPDGIREIDIRILGQKPRAIDSQVAAYIDSLKGLTYDLDEQYLQAIVVAPRTDGRDHAIVRSDTHQIKLYAEDKADSVTVLDGLLKVLARYPAPRQYQPRFVFNGKPRFKIGGDPSSYSEFVLTPPYSPIRFVTKSGKMSELAIPGV